MSEFKIVFLSEFQSRHGGENSLLAVLPPLMRHGVLPLVVAPSSGDFADAVRRLGVDLIDFCRIDNSGAVFPQHQLREMLAKELRRISPDLVHANSLAMGRLSGPVVKHLNLAGMTHLRDIVRLNRQATADLNDHLRLIAVSRATRDYHVAQGISAEKCCVIYNGVDSNVFQFRPSTGSLHRELRLPDNALLIGNIGQLGLRKGHLPLFLAMQKIVEKRPESHLVMIGTRWSSKAESIEYEQTLYELADKQPLAGHVHFLGTRDDIPAIMNELTILIHSARQEPLGRVLLEAAASQVPVIATQVGGTAEIFEPLETQHQAAAILLSDPKEKNDLDFALEIARQTEALLNNDLLRCQMAQNARAIAESRFSVERCAASLLTQYREVLEARR